MDSQKPENGKRINVPRASLTVQMLHDPEFIDLMRTPTGREAGMLFVCLILAGKDQDNDGVFRCSGDILALTIRWPGKAFKKAFGYLSKFNWVSQQDGSITVRNFLKWNPKDGRGGKRTGAGRPSMGIKYESKDIQRGINDENIESPLQVVTVTETAAVLSESQVGQDQPPRARENASVNSSARYDLRPLAVEAFRKLPSHVRRKQPPFERAFADAVVAGNSPVFLNTRLAAYYASPEGSGQWFREPANWLEQRGYAEPDEAWQGRESLAAASRPKNALDAEIERSKKLIAQESANGRAT